MEYILVAAKAKPRKVNLIAGSPPLKTMYNQGTEACQKIIQEIIRVSQITADWPKICERAAKRSEQFIRTQLGISYDRVLKVKSGALKRVWADSSIIMGNHRGILIYPGTKESSDVYKRYASFQYGAVYGPREKHMHVDTAQNAKIYGSEMKPSSILGASAKRSIKKAHFTGKQLSERARARIENPVVLHKGTNRESLQRRGVQLTEVQVRAARPITLDQGQIEAIVRVFENNVNDEIRQSNARRGIQ